jgi:hypothetical protein
MIKIRTYLAATLISAALICLVFGTGKDGTTTRQEADNACLNFYNNCYGNCKGKPDVCYTNCDTIYLGCLRRAGIIREAVLHQHPTGGAAPPSKAGPNSTPTPTPPRKYPVKGPPRKLGPTSSSTPSATAKPILLAKPKPTPSPKPTPKKSDHGHH